MSESDVRVHVIRHILGHSLASTESKHLKRTVKLQAMGMIDNSARSRGDISFDEHLESLREHRER